MDNCPNCKVSLIGKPIPENIRHYYGDSTHWRRDIAIEYPEKYDGVWEYMCPDCKHTWPSEVAKLKASARGSGI